MNNTSVFIKSILDSSEIADTISVINSFSIVDLNNQLGGGLESELESDSSIVTTNDIIEYGKKTPKNKGKKNSLFKTRKNIKEDSDSDLDSTSSNSSSFEDSMDSTSISSDEYPLFSYYGSKKSNQSGGGAKRISTGMRKLKIQRGGSNQKSVSKKDGSLNTHLNVSKSYKFSQSTLNRLSKIPIGETFTFKNNEIKMTKKLKAETGLATAFATLRKDKRKY